MTVLSEMIVLCSVMSEVSCRCASTESLLTYFNINAIFSESFDCDCWMVPNWRVCNVLMMSAQCHTKEIYV